ncbi:MAG: membrane-bound lytic murein transglycosylase C [Colwellia sp.]
MKVSVIKISFSLTLISTLLLFSSNLLAKNLQEQSFDDIDRMLDQQFNQKNNDIDSLYNAYNDAINDAFNGITKKIEVKWPSNVKLPTKSTWVGYSKNLQTRSIVDYQAGELVIETLVTDNDLDKAKIELEAMAEKLTAPTTKSIENLDIVAQEVNKNLTKKGIKPAIKALKNNNVLKELLPKKELLMAATVNINEISLPPTNAVPSVAIIPAIVPVPAIITIPTTPTIAAKDKSISPNTLTTSSETTIENIEPTVKLDLVKTAEGSLLKMTVKFVNNYQKVLLANNFDDVKKFSKKYDVDISVILAIIETESSYNPRAISRVPAFGLMQLVPKTAGIDAHNYVHGQKKILSPDYLFDETNNLQLGTAYFKLLKSRYLRKIDDPQSRFYCAVSSYNTGVGNLAKTFTGKKNLSKAAKVINTMTSEEVYRYLLENLPAEETRNYLKKIVKRRAKYIHFDNETKEI